MGNAHIRHLARWVTCALVVATSLIAISSASATPLGDPFDLSRPAGTGSPASPLEDLAQLVAELKTTADPAVAERDRGRILAIIEGDPAKLVQLTDATFLDDRAYKGIPLLNTSTKVQHIVTGDTDVTVREVRFGDHAILDTSMLQFDDMAAPFTIHWEITELGTTFGTELEPASLSAAAGPASGHTQALVPLGAGLIGLGTNQINRFHLSAQPETTRLETKTIAVSMPAPNELGGGILDPNLKPGHETYAQIAVGASGAPTVPAVGQIAAESAVGQLHADIAALDPLSPTFLASANTAATQDEPLVAAMNSRVTMPKPSAAVGGAVDVQFANAEAYVSDRDLRVPPGGSVTYSVTNLDGIAHTFAVRQLHSRSTAATGLIAPGVLSYGDFASDVIASVTVDPNSTASVPVTPASDAYALWVGDPSGGDQAAAAVSLDRGPRKQSLKLGEGPLLPLHQSFDRQGNLWVTMANEDDVIRLTPTASALNNKAEPDHFILPGGNADPATAPPGCPASSTLRCVANAPVLGPGDVQVDGHGIVWVTLGAANAIARIDPAVAQPGTTNGIRIYNLEACTDATCRRPPPPVVAAPLTRIPLQLRLYEDGDGNTVMLFTEQNADAIGALRVSPAGTKLDEVHIGCGCLQPLGVALDPSGDVWFTEGTSNRIGRMTLDPTKPFSAAPSIRHYNIPPPPAPTEFVPGDPLGCGAGGQIQCLPAAAATTLPHSVAIDRKGRVWYTGEANQTVGYLDPAQAVPNSQQGFHIDNGPINEFGRRLNPADIAIDAAGTAFISDEYGDQIGRATADGNGAVQAAFGFRPTARNSLTDSPLIDPDGNLWFMEGGANLITRISGVAAGVPFPAQSPLFVANTATGRITGSGLREMTSVDIRVIRGGQVVAGAGGVPVQAGSIDATIGTLAGDDRLEFVPNGAHPPASFSFRVASLSATIAGNGTVVGSARTSGAPLPDSVTIDAAGRSVPAAISSADGGFAWAGGLNPVTGGGTVSWTAGTVSARLRTVTPFGAPQVAGAVAPAPAAGGAKPAPKPAPKPAACLTGAWLNRTGTGRASRRTVPLLGLSGAEVLRCVGKPAKRKGKTGAETWTYRGSKAMTVRFTKGRVSAFTVTGRGLPSAPDKAAVGARLTPFRTALGAVARNGRTGYRGIVAVGKKQYADVRLTMKSSRVTRIAVTLKPISRLDGVGRRLLRSIR